MIVARRHHARALVIAAVFVGALTTTTGRVAGQERETLETKVSVSGDLVSLTWSKKHPWDRELSAQGAFLLIEYRSERGTGLECGVPAAGRRGACTGIPGRKAEGRDRTLAFQLPPALTAKAQGPVCLHLRLADQRPLPIRRSSGGENTARFEAVEWTRRLAQMAARSMLEDQKREADAAVATQMRGIEQQASQNASKRWMSEADCAGVTGGAIRVTRDRPVAEPQDHDALARQLCVMRLATGHVRLRVEAERATASGAFGGSLGAATLAGVLTLPYAQPLPAFEPLLAMVSDESRRATWMDIRGAQLAQIARDWVRFEPTLARYRRDHPVPHFESAYAELYLQTLTVEAGRRVQGAIGSTGRLPSERVKDALGVIGGSLEAYDRCVADGKQQLLLNYTQSVDLKERLPELEARLKEQGQQECRASVGKLAAMQQRVTELKEVAAGVERQLQAMTVPPLDSRTRELNAVTCTP